MEQDSKVGKCVEITRIYSFRNGPNAVRATWPNHAGWSKDAWVTGESAEEIFAKAEFTCVLISSKRTVENPLGSCWKVQATGRGTGLEGNHTFEIYVDSSDPTRYEKLAKHLEEYSCRGPGDAGVTILIC